MVAPRACGNEVYTAQCASHEIKCQNYLKHFDLVRK